MSDALSIYDELKSQYLRYYDTPFAVRDEAVLQERRNLLLQDAAISREPWLEPIAPYAGRPEAFAESCAQAGSHPDLAGFASPGLLPAGAHLRTHQFEALKAAEGGRHVIVTAGTGSGKTEAFLLPLFSSLLSESEGWPRNGIPTKHNWWAQPKPHFERQREHEGAREAAVRALVLYPMNALVDDQLKRLRSALDSDRARRWLDDHRGGHRFYFGRYTSRTPLAGPIGSDRERRLARQLTTMASRAARVRQDKEKRFFLAQLDGAEMRSRWDMQADPPDILITNYSMLNVMLLRSIEQPMFASTAAWLAAGVDRRFTIVVDELHMYRGTPGTEIRFLLRNLLDRLGIARSPDKVRFLAASASAGGDTEAFDRFIEGFFAQPRCRFAVLPGALSIPAFDPSPLAAAARPLAAAGRQLRRGDKIAAEHHIAEAAEAAGGERSPLGLCTAAQADAALLYATTHNDVAGNPAIRAQPASAIGGALFPDLGSAAEQLEALRALLHAMELSHAARGGGTLRAHYFFRNIPGIWACSSPDCGGALRIDGQARSVGKLFRSHRLSCDACASRVLELMYCQTCGELFLGGFRAEDPDGDPGVCYLVPDNPGLDRLPDFATANRTASIYAMFWPRPGAKPAVKPWTRDGGAFKMAFRACAYDARTGRLDSMPADGGDGVTFEARGPLGRDYPALPTMCPHCGDDWERVYAGRAEDPGRAQSPVRYMRSGFEKVTQVLADALLRSIAAKPEERKLVAFTDSRQDAAKLSAGMERRHYEDTVRQLIARAMKAGAPGAGDLALFDARLLAGDQSPEALAGFERFRSAHPIDANLLMVATMPFASAKEKARAAEARARYSAASVAFDDLADETERRLLALGINPSGPDVSRQSRRGVEGRWTALFDFDHEPPIARDPGSLNEQRRTWLSEIRHDLRLEALKLVFAARRRDFESIGIGYAALEPSPMGELDPAREQAASASLRILGDDRQYRGPGKSRDDPPVAVREYLATAEREAGLPAGELAGWVRERLERDGVVREWVIQPSMLRLSAAGGEMWRCGHCRQVHLHPAAGVCTNCLKPLPAECRPTGDLSDYYAYLAAHEHAFRLRAEELTGQTDWERAQDRQAQFQGIFLGGGETALLDEIDMLSVTTTMEVGVDIGSLRAVLMGNMPPMRFNYQQRVGRAGRRNDPLAAALTMCRGRSHDDYYFLHPERITGDPPPVPYLDLSRDPIVRRSALSEVLRRAFAEIRAEAPGEERGNVHGAFGKAAEWPQYEAAVDSWLRTHRPEIQELAAAMLEGCDDALREREAALVAYLSGGAVARIGAVAGRDGNPGDDLSQRLAEAGLLPMFGFPSGVRTLYHEKPQRWPPRDVIERDASLALSVWAPASEIVKDKQMHRVVGVAAYTPKGREAEPLPNALGPERHVGQCTACATVDTSPDGDRCPSCGEGLALAGEPGYRRLTVVQPLGYRTDYQPSDYRDWFEWTASGTRPRMSSHPLDEYIVRGARIGSSTAELFEINDNNGKDWEFTRQSDGHGWIVQDALVKDSREATKGWQVKTHDGEKRTVALGAMRMTDVLTVGLEDGVVPPWACLDPRDLGRRAAWYSAGFLLRGAASRYLEVQTGELEVGVRALRRDADTVAQVFLADSLANGAGYCTHLGHPENFTRLLDEASAWGRELMDGDRHTCDSACYDCLKDYRNAPYHGLLDWRLALDVLTLLRGEALDPDQRWARAGEAALTTFCEDLDYELAYFDGTPAAVDADGNRALIAVHPFEHNPPQPLRHDLRAFARQAAAARGLKLHTASLFELTRMPSAVFRRFKSA